MNSTPHWNRNLEYYITDLLSENSSDIKSISQNIVSHYKNSYITKSDEKLLGLFFKENVSQKDLDNFLNEWDIEKEGAHKALMLSYFMKNHPELTYSPYIEPRLNGILKYYRFRNLNLTSHFKKICTAIKNKNIDILIIKGGAFRHYRPEFPRIMGDIDIFVPQKDYKKAKKTALELGYQFEEFPHSIDLHDPKTKINLLDIHHKLDTQTSAGYSVYKDLFGRAHKDCVFNVNNIYIPCPEDMMFLLLINLNKNMAQNTSFPSILYSITDSAYLINMKPDFDWNIVRENAVKTKTEYQVAITLKFLNQFVPVKFPEMFENEFYDKSILCLYNGLFLDKMRQKSHSLIFKEIFKKSDDLIYYLKFRPSYIVYKQKFIRNNVNLAKFVLKHQNLIEK